MERLRSDLKGAKRELASMESEVMALRAEKDALANDASREVQEALWATEKAGLEEKLADAESRLTSVVAKAKEHARGLQARLEADAKAHAEQAGKLAEDRDRIATRAKERIAELQQKWDGERAELARSLARVEETNKSMESYFHSAPQDAAVELAVEADGEVWCFLRDSATMRKHCWWRRSELAAKGAA